MSNCYCEFIKDKNNGWCKRSVEETEQLFPFASKECQELYWKFKAPGMNGKKKKSKSIEDVQARIKEIQQEKRMSGFYK